MGHESYDVIGAEIHRKAMGNLTNEMAIAMIRTSGSPIVVEAKDFSACFMDTVPEHLGFVAYVLMHLGSSIVGTQAIADAVAEQDIEPGDGWLVNDPHDGGALHQGDVGVIMPTFYEGQHLGWAFVNMHVLDVGGVGVSGYAPGAHDVFEEGLRFPPIKIIRDGAIDEQWEKFIAANVRAPDPVLNDIRSMISGCNVASAKLGDIVHHFGYERHLEFCQINKNLSEQVLRERISRMPDGVYETIGWNEFDGHEGPEQLLEIRLRLEVSGSDLHFHFSGVPQIDAFVNSTRGAVLGGVMSGLLTMLGYGDLPLNGGVLRPITLDLGEPGTVVNANPPAPVSNAHAEVGCRVMKSVQEVLNQALALSDDAILRGRVKGQAQDGFPGVSLYGANQYGGTSVLFYVDNAVGAGGGAQSIHDGQDCYGSTAMTGCGLADVEGHEAVDPILFLWRRIVPNSGGPGQYRGGQALEQAYALHYSNSLSGPGFNSCAQIPPHGFGGGYPASTGDWYPLRNSNVSTLLESDVMPLREQLEGLKDRVRSKMTRVVIQSGDVVIVASGGGAGLGDPLLRDPEAVRADLHAGYVTPGHARAAYGVVLTSSGEVDVPATAVRRAEIRIERISGTPSADLQMPMSSGVSLIREGGVWTCGYCKFVIAGEGESWRKASLRHERPILEHYAEFEMYIRQRTEAPKPLIREYFCPKCAGALSIDITTNEANVPGAYSSRNYARTIPHEE